MSLKIVRAGDRPDAREVRSFSDEAKIPESVCNHCFGCLKVLAYAQDYGSD